MTQDRTKAIVEAAERLVEHVTFDVPVRFGHPVAITLSHPVADLRSLAEAVALPSPQWTRTPPDEPGYYWVRRTDGEGDQMEFLVLAMPQVNETRSVELGDGTMDLSAVLGSEWEWFPVRIEEPPS